MSIIFATMLFLHDPMLVPVASPPPPSAPNYDFDCAIYPTAKRGSNRITGWIRSGEAKRSKDNVPTGYREFTVSVTSQDARFDTLVEAKMAMPISLQNKIFLTGGENNQFSSNKTTGYLFDFPSSINDKLLKSSVAVWVKDYSSKYGADAVLTGTGICDLKLIEAAK